MISRLLLSLAIKVSAIPISNTSSRFSATKGLKGSTAMVLIVETEAVFVRTRQKLGSSDNQPDDDNTCQQSEPNMTVLQARALR